MREKIANYLAHRRQSKKEDKIAESEQRNY